MMLPNVLSLLRRSVERHGNRIALIDGDRRWTYDEWMRRVRGLAGSLSELGVRPSDRVGILTPTSELSVTAYYACQFVGAVAVPINHRLSAGEVAQILGDSGTRVLLYAGSVSDNALASCQLVRAVHSRICWDDGTAFSSGAHDYETLCETDVGSMRPFNALPGDPSSIMYTSGTTGKPKGVLHTHGNDVAVAINCTIEYGLSHNDRALHIAPFHHVGGLQAFFVPHVMVGATNVLQRRFSAAAALSAIEHEHITTVFAVPTQITRLIESAEWEVGDVSTVRLLTTGGAAASNDTMSRVGEKLGATVYNGYGMTEASLSLLLHAEDAPSRPGSCGKPTLMTSCRIVRFSRGVQVSPSEELPAGEIGELIVRGPHITPGYWNNGPATDEAIRDGWLFTGDLFSIDTDGFYAYHGRTDDLIVTGGENVYPREVEQILERCPGVKEVTVVGVPDANWGTAVGAFIVTDQPELSADSIDAYCRDSADLAPFKRPRFIEFVSAIPRNASGKPLRKLLGIPRRDVSEG